jgi:hypothetical protein
MGHDAATPPRLRHLADVLVKYSTPPVPTTREEEYTETVEKEVVEEKTSTETRTVDRGPHVAGYVVAVLGLAAAIGLFILIGAAMLSIVVAVASLAIGTACLVWLRTTEDVTVETTEEVPTTVVEEVTKTRVIEETPSSARVCEAGCGSLVFHVTETPDGSVVQGPEAIAEEVALDVPTVQRPQVVYDATAEVQDTIEKLPWVLDGTTEAYPMATDTEESGRYADAVPLRGEERALREYFQGVEAAFTNLTSLQVRIRALVDPDLFASLRPLLDSPRASSGEETPDGPAPLSDLTSLLELFDGPHGQQLEAFAQSWESKWTRINLALLEARSESLFEQVGPDCYQLGQQIGYTAFNFYCPYCNGEQQEDLLNRSYDVHDSHVHEPVRYSNTTRCLYRPEDDVWECRTCERTSEDPIPIHRMLDDVLFPAYDYLMQENKNERLRIHAKARDKERDLQEKADRQLDEINREHMSRIFSLSEEMERFEADIAGEHDAIASMKALLEDYAEAQNESVRQIEAFTERVKEEVRDRTQTVLSEIDAVKEQEMKAFQRDMEALSKAQRIEDQRRDKLLRDVAQHTKRSADANERSAAANERSARANEQQVEEQRKTRTAIKDQTKTIEEGQTSIEEQLSKQTAIRKAEQRRLGLETDNYSSVTNPVRSVKDMGAELKGKITGRAQEDIERDKLENA